MNFKKLYKRFSKWFKGFQKMLKDLVPLKSKKRKIFKKKSKRRLRIAGQALLEMLLIMGVIIAFWTGSFRILKNMGLYETVFGQPWGRLKSTIEFGIPDSKFNQVAQKHPASADRHSTPFATTPGTP